MEQPSHPKKWKMALLIWCFIYPLITTLSMLLVPLMADFHGALKTLIMSFILVPLMAFFLFPLLINGFMFG